jgi:hypothetical protein
VSWLFSQASWPLWIVLAIVALRAAAGTRLRGGLAADVAAGAVALAWALGFWWPNPARVGDGAVGGWGWLVALVLVVVWTAVAWFAARFAAARWIEQPGARVVVASAAAAAFVLGALWYRPDLVPPPPAPATAAGPVAAAPPAAAPPVAAPPAAAPPAAAPAGTMAPLTVKSTPGSVDVAKKCPPVAVPANAPGGRGTIDTVLPAGKGDQPAVADGATIGVAEHYLVYGWAADRTQDRPAAAVCLVVDGKVVPSAGAYYGAPRPDVAAMFRSQNLTGTGFAVELPGSAAGAGSHRIQVATVSADGSVSVINGSRTYSVK